MKKLESGRSMIEMLGVLAIIGVLSIGGLAGYTMAMNRHRVNQILDYASKCGVMVQTKGDGSAAVTEADGKCDAAGLMGTNTLPPSTSAVAAKRNKNSNTVVIVTWDGTATSGTLEAFGDRASISTPTASGKSYLNMDDGKWSATDPSVTGTTTASTGDNDA